MSKMNAPHTLSAAIEKLEEVSHSKTGEIKEFVDKELKVVKEALKEMKPMIDEAKERTIAKAQEVKHETEAKIKENPWWAVGIIGFVAFLFGFILGSHRKD